MRNANLVNKNRFIQYGANIAQRSGTGALSLGATDFLISGKERKLDPIFFARTKEEGKTGKELAAARLANKIKFAKEGALIGAGFPLIGAVAGGAVRTLGYGVGVTYDLAGRVVNPVLTLATKALALDPVVLPSIDYSNWKRFTVDSTDPVKSGLKKIDNALSWIRSAGKNMAEAAFVKGSASREIRASAKRIQDLLKSIENKSYDLAKGFEGMYNTNKTSPSLMNQYMDEVLEVLEGKRKLTNLPKILQHITNMYLTMIVLLKHYKQELKVILKNLLVF
jgi:fructose 1,6-bisphosphatase